MPGGSSVTIETILADVARAVEIENETYGHEQDKGKEPSFCPVEDKPKPLTPAETQVCKYLLTEPPPAKFILNCRGIPFMRQGVVSLLVSMGGIGKTYFLLCLAHALSSGNRWGCFEPEQAYKTLFIGAEDDTSELSRRLWIIGKGDFPTNLHAVSMSGKIQALMEMNGENPVRSKWYDWLRETIEAHMPLDILFLDPLSRLYGLSENRNEHATAFIQSMEALSIKYGINIVVSHHANKDSSNQVKAKQGMARGASGFIDGVRFGMALSEVTADEANNYGLENPEHYFKLDIVKSNGSAKLESSLFFKKNPDTGLPEYTPISMVRIEALALGFLSAFREYGSSASARDLKKGLPPELFAKIKGNLTQINVSKDIKPILSYLIEHNFLLENRQSGRGWRSLIYTLNLENEV
jgi:replicative DNA helicase